MRNKTSFVRNRSLGIAAFTLVLLSSVSYGNSDNISFQPSSVKPNTNTVVEKTAKKSNNKLVAQKTVPPLPWLVEDRKLILLRSVEVSASSLPNFAGVVVYSYYADRKANVTSIAKVNKAETPLPWLVAKTLPVQNIVSTKSEQKGNTLLDSIALATSIPSKNIANRNYDTIITKLEPAAMEVEKLNDGVVDATTKIGDSLPANIELPKPEIDNKVKEIISELKAEEKSNKDNHVALPAITNSQSEKNNSAIQELPTPNSVNKEDANKVDLDHLHKNSLDNESDVKRHDGVGITLSVKTPKVNVDQLLENAYDAAIAGNQEEAILTYRKVLSVQPNSKLGLFGLATVYHRAGQTQLARPLYRRLLDLYPNSVEGLNNYLVLLSDEDPREALVELEKLERSHIGFSPIPAQMAVIYEKLGDYYKAARKMSQAMELSPENLKYRYNMAIILDQQGDWEDAATFYRQLIVAEERGEKIPANSQEIQERLTFILSNKPDRQ